MPEKAVAIKLFQSQGCLKWRPIWLKLHLYLGLSFGLVFVMAGLTGSVLVFYNEIDEWIHPELQIKVIPNVAPKSNEAIFQALRSAHPERPKAWRLEMPRNKQTMVMARYYKPHETVQHHFAPLMAWVNPYTAEVVDSRFWGQYLVTWLFDLHYSLLLDLTGKTIMACIGGVIMISLFSGLYLWWPVSGKFKTALKFKRSASKARLIYDLHKTNGIYSFVLMLIIVITGIVLELPDFFNPGINRLSPLYKAKSIQSSYQTGDKRISVDKAAAIAEHQFPGAILRWIETPMDQNGSYRIQLYQDGEPSKRFPKTMVWVDQYSGAILEVRSPMIENSAGDTFISWLHPLHNGEVAGLTGRWLVFFLGFTPLILFVTGLIRWLQKRKAHQLKLAKA